MENINYTELINRFWELNRKVSFTPNERSVYFSLLYLCHNLEWKNPFKQSNENLAVQSNLTKKDLITSLNMLKQAGLIEFDSTNEILYNMEYTIKYLNSSDKVKSKKNPLWKTDFEVYLQELRDAYKQIINNDEFITQRQEYHPNLNIQKSIEKACVDFWAKKTGWQKKKQSKTKEIDWETTFINALNLSCNRVYKQKEFNI